MRNSRRFRGAVLASMLLGVTGANVVWADSDRTVEDVVPSAPKSDNGVTARVGTAAGTVYGAPANVTALGFTAAIGQRFGRLAIEAEYTYLSFQEQATYHTPFGVESGDIGVGDGNRLDLMLRLDLLRFGPHVDRSSRSLFTIYVEGGAGVAVDHWNKPTSDEMNRVVPDDTKRVEGQGGFGLMIFPHRVAWMIGWRFAVSPHEDAMGSICRGTSVCRSVEMNDTSGTGSLVDRSMLFQSSLEFTF
jgi:hypothetical protein